MIPFPIPPLTGLSVLVTRPQPQADDLCRRIVEAGGDAIAFPAIAIAATEVRLRVSPAAAAEPVVRLESPTLQASERQTVAALAVMGSQVVPPLQPESANAVSRVGVRAPHYDVVIFVSANAVRHGLAHVQRGATTRFAAVGPATAAALAAANAVVDLVPESGFDSESLLRKLLPFLDAAAHSSAALESATLESAALESAAPDSAALDSVAVNSGAGARVLIVRGEGGRELLYEQIVRHGVQVDLLEVYRRELPSVDAALLQQLADAWNGPGVDVVTATSVETLQNLLKLLPEPLVARLKQTPLLTVSGRIAQAARDLGWQEECWVAKGGDENSLIGALAVWHTRARIAWPYAGDCPRLLA